MNLYFLTILEKENYRVNEIIKECSKEQVKKERKSYVIKSNFEGLDNQLLDDCDFGRG